MPRQEPDWVALEQAYQRMYRDTQLYGSSLLSTRLTNEDSYTQPVSLPPPPSSPTGRLLGRVIINEVQWLFTNDGMLSDHFPTEQVSAIDSPTDPTTSSKVKNTYRDFIRKHTNTG